MYHSRAHSRRFLGLLAVLAPSLAGGCFQPQLQDGDVACGAQGECPPGFLCDRTTDTCVVDPSQPSDASVEADGSGDPLAARAGDPLALYLFDEGDGIVVGDRSGRPQPLDLAIDDPAQVTWNREDGTLRMSGEVHIVPPGLTPEVASARVRTVLQDTLQMTLEAWVTPDDGSVPGPRRIVSLSSENGSQSFALVHGGPTPALDRASYSMRLRTSDVDDDNGKPEFDTARGTAVAGVKTHVVFTRDKDGTVVGYLDGQPVATTHFDPVAGADNPSAPRTGDFSTWEAVHVFHIGNELQVPIDELGIRHFRGLLHLVAVYDRVLTPDEVDKNFAAGSDPEVR